MMKKNLKARQILIDFLISLLKVLIFLKKLIVAFFVWVIFKPLRFIFKLIFSKLFVKLYGVYILGLKKLREFNQRHQSQYALIKRVAAPVVLGLIALLIMGNNLFNKPDTNADLTGKMFTAPAAQLMPSETDVGPPEQLITVTGPAGTACTAPQQYLPENDILTVAPQITTLTTPGAENTEASCLTNNGESLINPAVISTGTNVPSETTAPAANEAAAARTGLVTYTVQSGDTLASVARRFGISANTIIWANGLGSSGTIHEGDKLTILPTTGTLHTVKAGENLNAIADKYGVAAGQIISYNNLGAAATLQIGQQLIIPGGRQLATPQKAAVYVPRSNANVISVIKDILEPAPADTGTELLWPTIGHNITQYFSWRHPAIDIANKTGTPVYAAADGVVEVAGWNSGGYGNMILIDHPNGMKTRYGHASKLLVSAGDEVKRGQVIMLMGETGHATGPHVHFEVYVGSTRVNPLNYVR
jgi:murein DD-endopeptidase MepM/ murein hydrolase activator NlpD